MRFRTTRRGIEASPDEDEAAFLRRLALDLVALLGEAPEAGADPLEALVGLSSTEAAPPEDPALARLLPDAYGGDDPAASREFRRYTDVDLRAGKRANAEVVARTLPAAGGRMVLDREQADAWLGCLNDLRLVLGTRLDVTEDLDEDRLAADDPRRSGLQVYGWLGWLQESLVACLLPRR